MNATEIQVKDRKGKQKAGEGAPVRLRVTPPKKEKAGTQDKGDASIVTQPPEEREPEREDDAPLEHKEDKEKEAQRDGLWGNEKHQATIPPIYSNPTTMPKERNNHFRIANDWDGVRDAYEKTGTESGSHFLSHPNNKTDLYATLQNLEFLKTLSLEQLMALKAIVERNKQAVDLRYQKIQSPLGMAIHLASGVSQITAAQKQEELEEKKKDERREQKRIQRQLEKSQQRSQLLLQSHTSGLLLMNGKSNKKEKRKHRRSSSSSDSSSDSSDESSSAESSSTKPSSSFSRSRHKTRKSRTHRKSRSSRKSKKARTSASRSLSRSHIRGSTENLPEGEANAAVQPPSWTGHQQAQLNWYRKRAGEVYHVSPGDERKVAYPEFKAFIASCDQAVTDFIKGTYKDTVYNEWKRVHSDGGRCPDCLKVEE
ncbi:hypothetical protein HK097_003745 [Rhizophlyctis rosea]|uniref:Uncharacterized protein n=1 Tax=Rhizophlyctis rosea TaxID=64517 RepID=A0AAD5WXS4_9FUNG|nr:hypothetical protein HK097_003745 [Rhizophlyctis rosea]